jgi:hypothetical protein
MTLRKIEEIKKYRSDYCPFLTHLTRDKDDEGGPTAKEALIKILTEKKFEASCAEISAAKFGVHMPTKDKWERDEKKLLFSAICFSETPIHELQSLLHIEGRLNQLKPYGLILIKERLIRKHVSPVFYINNELADKDGLVQELMKLRDLNLKVAHELLPLLQVFGKRLTAPKAKLQSKNEVDFCWEREWRCPATYSPLKLEKEDIFLGICPHSKIEKFESDFRNLKFIDPRRNIESYSAKIEKAISDKGIPYSVI